MRLHFRMGGKSRTQYGVLYLCEFRFDPIRYASTIVYEMLLISYTVRRSSHIFSQDHKLYTRIVYFQS